MRILPFFYAKTRFARHRIARFRIRRLKPVRKTLADLVGVYNEASSSR